MSVHRAVSMNMTCTSRLIAGVVDEDVNGSQLAGDRFEKRRDLGFGADVAPPGPGAPAAPARIGDELRGRRVLLAIGDRDRGAALGEELRDPAADAARPAGDDGDTAVELKSSKVTVYEARGKIISGFIRHEGC